jgi:hypothetical protein
VRQLPSGFQSRREVKFLLPRRLTHEAITIELHGRVLRRGTTFVETSELFQVKEPVARAYPLLAASVLRKLPASSAVDRPNKSLPGLKRQHLLGPGRRLA